MIDYKKQKIGLFIAAIGLWLFVSPMTFGEKSSFMMVSDCVTGGILFLLGLLIYKFQRLLFCYAAALTGIWLQLAPLFFWAPEAYAYLNDSLVGFLAILLAFQVPGMIYKEEELLEELPPGWSFNPSSWLPRVITVSLALVAFFLARYLACYQLGYIHEMEDPFFGDGTVKVITSSVSKRFPVPDAGLGAFGYSLEFILGILGGRRRWKTMPWLSVFFGAMVVPAGIVSILLIISQPIFVGAWCGICLLIAVCMLAMIVLTAPEVVAVLQLLYRVKKERGNFWQVFWKGSDLPIGALQKEGSKELGFSFPWNLVVCVFLGVWLMISPVFLGTLSPAVDSVYVVGPLLIAFSVIAFSEVIRFMRFMNIFLGLALIASSFFLDGFVEWGAINNVFVGVLIVCLTIRKGPLNSSCGRF